MGTKRYDREGNLTSYSVSDSEIARNNAANAVLLFVLALVVLPIVPFVIVGYLAGIYASKQLGFHDLFSIILGATPVVLGAWLLFKFGSFRKLYFSVYCVSAPIGFFFWLIRDKNADPVWLGFFSLIIFGILFVYFRLLHKWMT